MYGTSPKELGVFDVTPTEYQYIIYMPVKLPNGRIEIPASLEWTSALIDKCISDYGDVSDSYIYVSAKNFYVSGFSGNREGWHSDGFLSNDVNYIWSSSDPTEFCIQGFELSDCRQKSLEEMSAQAKDENINTYGVKTLVRIDQKNIHRVPFCKSGVRAFAKVSISKDKYALKGNAHNHLLDYQWEMSDRKESRNDPVKSS